jgi:phosphate transport system permease protein
MREAVLVTVLDNPPTTTADTVAVPAEAPVVAASEPPRDVPRRLAAQTLDDKLCLVGSFLGSLGLVWVLYDQILPTKGKIGFIALWFVAFVMFYALTTRLSNRGPVVTDRVVSSAIVMGAVLVLTALVTVVIYTFWRGHQAVMHFNFYSNDMAGKGPQDPLNRGGIVHAIVGSLIEIGLATAVTLPLGVGTAVFMTEVGGRLAKPVRTVVEAMTALPSIVAGLFIYTVFVVKLGEGKSGLAASLAIGVMMLPIIARASDVVLRVVPGGLREAGLALGSPRWRTVWHVVLPTARSGLATALILAIARGIGETSPVLLTSGASTYFATNPLNVINSLPLFVFSSVRSGEPLYISRGYGAASVLLAVVLILFIITRLIARGRKPGRKSLLRRLSLSHSVERARAAGSQPAATGSPAPSSYSLESQ